MPKKIDPELKARAVRLVLEHRSEYPTTTAAVLAGSPGRSGWARWNSAGLVDI